MTIPKVGHFHDIKVLSVTFTNVNLIFRYHQFKYEWQANKAPGEKSHKNLRWNVRVMNTFNVVKKSYLSELKG